LNATVTLSARRCFLPRLAFHRLKAKATLAKGRLRVSRATAIAGGGGMTMSVDLRNAGKTGFDLTTHLRLTELDAGRVQDDLGVVRRVEGRLDVDVRIAGRGRSIAEIMGTSNGHFSIIMGKGTLNSSLFRTFGGGMHSGLTRLFTPGDADTTDITCMVAHFKVTDGLASTTALVMDTPQVMAAGEGTIDLKTEALAMDVTPVPKEGLGASGLGRITLSFSELAKPLEVGGTLAAPTLSVNATDTALTIGKAIGGFTLFGPFGLAAALVGASAGDDNPCVAAVRKAREGRVPVSRKKPVPKKKADEGVLDSFGKTLKKWFGQ